MPRSKAPKQAAPRNPTGLLPPLTSAVTPERMAASSVARRRHASEDDTPTADFAHPARPARPARLALAVLILALGLPACSKSTAKKNTSTSKGPTARSATQSGPSARIVVPGHDCKTTPACLKAGFCTHEQGGCVVKRNEDCEAASVCKRDGKCKATKGLCVVGDTADCQQSSSCKHKGKCTLKKGTCAAASQSDCKQSKGCTHKGECVFQDGVCVGGKK